MAPREKRKGWRNLRDDLWWLAGRRSRIVWRPVWFGKRIARRYGLIVIKRVPRD